MKVLTRNVIYHGRDEPLPDRVALRAGPVSLFYEGGDLRYLRLGNREIVRRIYAVVRDRNWGTVPAKISNVDLVDRKDSFRVFYEAEHREGNVHFTWRAEILGEPSGRIAFTMDGQARSTFLKNRIGLCVLHPIHECAGAACRVQRADGSSANLHFPRLVAPEQPIPGFTDLVAFAHEDVPGRWIELKFSGDLFEMEDQRNWIDASYKTYCTPLRLPYPVEVRPGHRVLQQVAIEITGSAGIEAAMENPAIEIEVAATVVRRLPKLGLGASSLNQPLSEYGKARLSELGLAHLRTDLRLSSPEWRDEFARAWTEAQELKLVLEVALFLPMAGNVLWPEVRAVLQQARRNIVRFLVFAEGEKTTSARALGLARQHLADFRVPIGAGTNADFYQLNQARPAQSGRASVPASHSERLARTLALPSLEAGPSALNGADLIVWSMNPQVHAFDLASLGETPDGIRAQLNSAREYFPGKRLVVSPVTLKPRFNPVAAGPEPPVPAGELPPQVDPRQMSLFGAAGTLAAYKCLAESSIESVTFFETVGWRGIVETDDGPPLPAKFRSVARGVFPMYHVFADIGEFAGGETLVSVSSRPLAVNAVALQKEGRIAVLLANLSDAKQQVRISGLKTPARARILDETSADRAMRDPESFRERWSKASAQVDLPPFAYCRLDVNDGQP